MLEFFDIKILNSKRNTTGASWWLRQVESCQHLIASVSQAPSPAPALHWLTPSKEGWGCLYIPATGDLSLS